MNSPTSSYDDNVSESEATTEQAPFESLPPKDEPTVIAPASTSHDAPSALASVPARRAGRGGAVGWALLLALASLGVAGFALWQAYEWRTQSVNLREEVAKRLQESDQAVGEARARAQQEHESVNTILGKIGALEAQLSKSEGHAIALEALYQQFSRTQEDRIVAEIQQAVEFAGQQLRYAGNIEMALIVLREAQARLERSDHGQFMALRQALKADIEKLSRQDTFDMPRTAERLEHLLEKIDALPLAFHDEVSADKPSAKPVEKAQEEGFTHFIRSLAEDVWEELRSLVKFERLDTGNEPVLLALEQSAFLRENVKIRLLTARLAMLARDGHTYASDLERARGWLERFFDTSNKDVNAVIEELRALEIVPVGVIRNELIESAAAVGRIRTHGVEPPLALPPRPPHLPPSQATPEAAAESAQP